MPLDEIAEQHHVDTLKLQASTSLPVPFAASVIAYFESISTSDASSPNTPEPPRKKPRLDSSNLLQDAEDFIDLPISDFSLLLDESPLVGALKSITANHPERTISTSTRIDQTNYNGELSLFVPGEQGNDPSSFHNIFKIAPQPENQGYSALIKLFEWIKLLPKSNLKGNLFLQRFRYTNFLILSTTHENQLSITLRIKIEMKAMTEPDQLALSAHERHLVPLAMAFSNRLQWTGRYREEAKSFYDACYVPPMDFEEVYDVEGMECKLMGFQKRTVRWMLEREGVRVRNDGEIEEIGRDESDGRNVPCYFEEGRDRGGGRIWVSRTLAIVARKDDTRVVDYVKMIRGGILAEQMGLGKTVELLALVLLNNRGFVNESREPLTDYYTEREVIPIKATLIISPVTILDQWVSEIKRHTPYLRIYHYRGRPQSRTTAEYKIEKALQEFQLADIVITTYNIISKEVHYTTPPPPRNLRNPKTYVIPLSPLVRVQWWRVCLDEAQMVSRTISDAATVARLVPRVNAWAITGTPVRRTCDALHGLFVFLRLHPLGGSPILFRNRLPLNEFRGLVGTLALRHTKEKIRRELILPPQRRVVVMLRLSRIEEEGYRSVYEGMLNDLSRLGVTANHLRKGKVEIEGSVRERLGYWLERLRGLCLHPQVGGGNRVALGKRVGVLKSVADVLRTMVDGQLHDLRVEERRYFELIIYRVKQQEFWEEREDGVEGIVLCLPLVQEVLRAIRESIKVERAQLEKMAGKQSNGKGKEKAAEDEEMADVEENEDGTLTSSELKDLQRQLRSFLELEHVCRFFLGTFYFQMKEILAGKKDNSDSENGEEEADGEANGKEEAGDEELDEEARSKIKELEEKEIKAYEDAKMVRKELLKETETKARRYITQLSEMAKMQSFITIPDAHVDLKKGGIERQSIAEEFFTITEALNAQAELLDDWREKVAEVITAPLIDSDSDETTGEEYELSVQQQDQVFAYVDAIRIVLQERLEVLTGLHNRLTAQEIANLKKAKEQHSVLVVSLLAKREPINQALETIGLPGEPKQLKSIKGILDKLRNLKRTTAAVKSNRSVLEGALVDQDLTSLNKVLTEQKKALSDLEKEADLFRAGMNSRVDFYRQLQSISDSVESYSFESDPTPERARSKEEDPRSWEVWERKKEKLLKREAEEVDKIRQMKTRLRYLDNLNAIGEEKPECSICTADFDIGCLTTCGHNFCRECIVAWWKMHRRCPVCRTKLSVSDIYDVAYTPEKPRLEEEDISGTEGTHGKKGVEAGGGIYKAMDQKLLREIENIPLKERMGTKIDTITRHLLHIETHSPNTKSVVFTQHSAILSLLAHSLTLNAIPFTLASPSGIAAFRTDPTLTVFLLHAKSQSAGLTLTNATNVFLLEPLLNPALELQAINRVHRIGQKHRTTVWLYVIDGTVERGVLDIATRERRRLMDSVSEKEPEEEQEEEEENEAVEETVESSVLERDLGKSDGEELKGEELLKCLFGEGANLHKRFEERVSRLVLEGGEGTSDVLVQGEASASEPRR